jgi:geranylgeranyl reductase family protein
MHAVYFSNNNFFNAYPFSSDMMHYDVVIVGAGPAGLNCARVLGDAGKKVLLLEKNAEIGPKVCGGGLLLSGFGYLKSLGLPDELIVHRYHDIVFHSRFITSKVRSEKDLAFMIERKELGRWQLSLLDKKYVDVQTNALVTEIKHNSIIINGKKEISFDHLVGADGAYSVVRRWLRLPCKKMAYCFQYTIPGDAYKHFEIFYDSARFHTWYAWIMPHKGYITLGTGCSPEYVNPKKIYDNFHEWIHDNNIDISRAVYKSHAVTADYRGHRFGNVYLVGDAAGFPSALTGEGIYEALVSGEEIARMMLDDKYDSEKIRRILQLKKKHEKHLATMVRAGIFRPFLYELFGLLLKTQRFQMRVKRAFVEQ